MRVGVAEDEVKQTSLVAAKARLDLLRLAGLDSVRVSATWAPGQTSPSAEDLPRLTNAVSGAALAGLKTYVSISQFGSATTPLTDAHQDAFARYSASVATAFPALAGIIVGNEPNINRFWLPQFNADGTDAAAPAYETLLAKTYDAVKAAQPRMPVIGAALSPHGGDNPGGARPTHSPTVFIRDLGAAYRASGRTTPIMDVFGIHPYGDNSSQSPTVVHASTTIALADYGKLVTLLGQAFDGTAQAGSTLPILYDEYGVESRIPATVAPLYTGSEPTTTKPVDEATQAAYYTLALQTAFCQPNVVGILLFHAFDESNLDRWQSGLYYANQTAKSSLPAVRDAAQQVRRGVAARCEGLAADTAAPLPLLAARQAPPAGTRARGVHVRHRLRLRREGRKADRHGRRRRARADHDRVPETRAEGHVPDPPNALCAAQPRASARRGEQSAHDRGQVSIR